MRTASPPGFPVGVVGATGMVGRELLILLEKSRLPISELRPFSSGRPARRARFRGEMLSAPAPTLDNLSSCRLVFFASADGVSKRLAPPLAKLGVWAIDDSSAFRMSPGVPLIIPEINASALDAKRRIIAGPNCTMSGLGLVAAALDRAFGLVEIRAASYQSISGAGKDALSEFISQTRLVAGKIRADRADEFGPILRSVKSRALAKSAVFNVFPQVGAFLPNGDCEEEIKVVAELRKVLGRPDLEMSVTAVRVPTLRCHALAAWLRLKKPPPLKIAQKTLSQAPGLRMLGGARYPTPADCAGKTQVFVGRVRRGARPDEIALWIVSDNLLKGAAYNSLQIAEEIQRRGWI
ncbi:MAG: aspartate-semialdehyde dehydrogenase [Elusimicrobiota bacterium]